ncbi:hypothetical protein [Streptomyces sp. BV129]|uniref:hypothetical protein n=1 Tax=Streptomyces sp. BV129 TaxID=2849671 RepID=UPI001C2E324C|nr:hypothetical protein [Streptomyces sp. BV129]MBV1945444.1 hypothetical protein [Streptomyces sp. BV129]
MTVLSQTCRAAALTAALAVTVSACSVSDEGAGIRAAEVCGKFARTPSVASALVKVAGTERFGEDGSEPEKVLATLRAADGEVRAFESAGVPNCLLRPAAGGDQLVTVYFREAVVILKANAESEKTSTYYRTGASAASTDRVASIYFHCRMTSPKKEVIVNARLERESKVKLPGKEAADKQMTVANAAAKSVAQQLGCKGTNLSKGAPEAVSGVYGPR